MPTLLGLEEYIYYSLLHGTRAEVPGSNPPAHAFPLRDFPCASRVLRPAAGYAGLARRRGNDGLWIKALTPPTITPGFYGRIG